MKKILIALDYDISAEKVAMEGFKIAGDLNAETILFHVISKPNLYSSIEHITISGFAGRVDENKILDNNQEEARRISNLFLGKIKTQLNNTNVHTLVKEESIDFALSNIVTQVIADLNISFFVMGSYNKKYKEKTATGIFLEKILAHIVIPIIIIPL